MDAFKMTMHLSALFFQVFVAGLALLWGTIVAVNSTPVTSTDTASAKHDGGHGSKASKKEPLALGAGKTNIKDDKRLGTLPLMDGKSDEGSSVPSKYKKKAVAPLKKRKPKLLIRIRDPTPSKEKTKIAPWLQEHSEAMELARLRDEVLRKSRDQQKTVPKSEDYDEAIELARLREDVLRRNRGEPETPSWLHDYDDAMELARLRDDILRKKQRGELRPFEYLEAVRPKAPEMTRAGLDRLSLFEYFYALLNPVTSPPVPEEEEGPIYLDESLVEEENNYYDANEQDMKEHLEAGAAAEDDESSTETLAVTDESSQGPAVESSEISESKITEKKEDQSSKSSVDIGAFRQTSVVADVAANVANVASVVTDVAANVGNVANVADVANAVTGVVSNVASAVTNVANVVTSVVPSKTGSNEEESSEDSKSGSFRQTVDVADVVNNVASAANVATAAVANVANVVTDVVTNVANLATNVVPSKTGSDEVAEDSKKSGLVGETFRQTNVQADVAANVSTPVANAGVGVDVAVSLKSADDATKEVSSDIAKNASPQPLSLDDSSKSSIKSTSSSKATFDGDGGKKSPEIDTERGNDFSANSAVYPVSREKIEESLSLLRRVMNGNARFSKSEMTPDVKARLDSLGLPEGSALGLLGSFFDPLTIANVLLKGMSKNWSQLVQAAVSAPEFVEKLNASKKNGQKSSTEKPVSDARQRESLHEESELNLKYFDSIETVMKEMGREIDSKKNSNSNQRLHDKSDDGKPSSSYQVTEKSSNSEDTPFTLMSTASTVKSVEVSSESTSETSQSSEKVGIVETPSPVPSDHSETSIADEKKEASFTTTTPVPQSTTSIQKHKKQQNKKTSPNKNEADKNTSESGSKKKSKIETEELSISPQLPTFWVKH